MILVCLFLNNVISYQEPLLYICLLSNSTIRIISLGVNPKNENLSIHKDVLHGMYEKNGMTLGWGYVTQFMPGH